MIVSLSNTSDYLRFQLKSIIWLKSVFATKSLLITEMLVLCCQCYAQIGFIISSDLLRSSIFGITCFGRLWNMTLACKHL